jgi:hypothetical protein
MSNNVKPPIITPDPPPRDTPWHRKIVRTAPIPGTKTGNDVELECGHWVRAFGRLELTEGRVLCDQCRMPEYFSPEPAS